MCDHYDGYESRNVFVKFYKTKKNNKCRTILFMFSMRSDDSIYKSEWSLKFN